MFDKSSKIPFNPRVNRKINHSACRQTSRSETYCAACDLSFTHLKLFEEHLHTEKHALIDSPLEFILHRVGESDKPTSAEEYKKLRLQCTRPESDHRYIHSDEISINGLLIGADCISRVQVLFCEVCQTYIPEDSSDALQKHCSTNEHLNKSLIVKADKSLK